MNRIQRKAAYVKEVEKQRAKAKRIIAIGRFLPFGLLFGTKYKRRFEAIDPGPRNKPYLEPKEAYDKDESELFQELAETFADDTGRLEPGLGVRDDDFKDPHWGHSTGLLHGELEIDDLSAIDKDLRKGLFETPGVYRAVCRPNFLYDPSPLIAISRMSVKIETPFEVDNLYASDSVAKELDLLLSEGVPPGGDGDGRGFFFRDARQMLLAQHMKPGGWARLKRLLNSADAAVLTDWRSNVFVENTDNIYVDAQQTTGWAGKYYFSAGPYALGPGAIKYCLKPLQDHPITRLDVELDNPSEAHKAELMEWAEAEREIAFDLCIQVATLESIPDLGEGHPVKEVMAAEYADIAWDETHAPFKRVGTLRVKASPPNDLDRAAKWYALPFNAWNTHPDMRPLGQLFRARKVVHSHHRAERLKHSFDSNEAERFNGCPFTPPRG